MTCACEQDSDGRVIGFCGAHRDAVRPYEKRAEEVPGEQLFAGYVHSRGNVHNRLYLRLASDDEEVVKWWRQRDITKYDQLKEIDAVADGFDRIFASMKAGLSQRYPWWS